MKKVLSLLVFGITTFVATAQNNHLSVRPDGVEGVDANVNSRSDFIDNNYGDQTSLRLHGGTGNGGEQDARAFLKLKQLDLLPEGVMIDSVKLTLYNNLETPIFESNGANGSQIYLVTEDWDEYSVTWNDQPLFDENSGVRINNTLTSFESVQVDITSLVKDIVEEGKENFGFLVKLDSEDPYRNLAFSSSDASDENKRPLWDIYYSVEESKCDIFRPDGVEGVDANVNSRSDFIDNNYGDQTSLRLHGGTGNGGEQDARAFMKLNEFDNLPEGAVIDSVKLTLYNNLETPIFESNGANSSQLYLVTEDWSESVVTWNAQPAFDPNFAVSVNGTLTDFDSVEVDITALAVEIVENGKNNFGFALKLDSEDPYRNLAFSSSDAADENKRPLWKVCYTTYVKDIVLELDVVESISQNVYPNPTEGEVNFVNSISGIVYDVQGNFVANIEEVTSFDFSNSGSGLFIIVTSEGEVMKVVVK